MGMLVVGSVGYDTVWTPLGSGTDLLGGSATYFSISASYFSSVSLVAVVGRDFRSDDIALLKNHGVNTNGLEIAPGKTFRWSGRYNPDDVNLRDTLDTQLNVFSEFEPSLDREQRNQEYLFLANIDPELQLQVLNQMERRPKLVAVDTMNFWIDSKKPHLSKVIELADVVFMDEGELRSFSEEANLVKAAKVIMAMGPKTVVAKQGEHGVLLFEHGSVFAAPAYPIERVVDPTGAGDSFAGGFMGYLASEEDTTDTAFRHAAILGSVMGSFAVESLSVEKLRSLSYQDVVSRFRDFWMLTNFNPLGSEENLPWQTKNDAIYQ